MLSNFDRLHRTKRICIFIEKNQTTDTNISLFECLSMSFFGFNILILIYFCLFVLRIFGAIFNET